MDYRTDEGEGSSSSSMDSAPLDSDYSSDSDEDEHILIDLIIDKRWDDVMARMKTEEGREEMRRKGSYGRLPLHWACWCGAPLELVEAMVEAYPEAVRVTNNGGRLPLHAACCHDDISPRVVRLLLDAHPEGAKVTDNWGGLPLHTAAQYKAPLDVFVMLIDAHPEGAATRNKGGRLPLHLLAVEASPAKEEDVSKVVLLLKPVLRDDGAFNATGSYDGEGRHPLQIAAEFGLSRVLEGVPIVHACLRTKYDCPPNTIHHVMMRHPGQLRHAHEGGNYPLHVAAANRNLNGVQVEVDADPDPDQGKRKRESKDLIALLVESYPEAAGRRNDDGRLPLSLAIECGKPWDGGVEAIADAAKDVIAEKDDSTELYPFMIAAIGDHSCLSTVYRLLRHCPELKRYRID